MIVQAERQRTRATPRALSTAAGAVGQLAEVEGQAHVKGPSGTDLGDGGRAPPPAGGVVLVKGGGPQSASRPPVAGAIWPTTLTAVVLPCCHIAAP